MNSTRFVGLDVHAQTIAVAEPSGEIRSLDTVPNRPQAIRRLAAKLGPADRVRVCYEAGPCGYVLYWQLTALDLRVRGGGPHAGANQRVGHRLRRRKRLGGVASTRARTTGTALDAKENPRTLYATGSRPDSRS
jgi:hypothetical protein